MIKLRVHYTDGTQGTFTLCEEKYEELLEEEGMEEAIEIVKRKQVDWFEEWRETNTECLTRIMEHSENGGLMQGFIMQALAEYSEEVINAPINAPEKNEDGSVPFVSPTAWRNCALELKDELDKFYS